MRLSIIQSQTKKISKTTQEENTGKRRRKRRSTDKDLNYGEDEDEEEEEDGLDDNVGDDDKAEPVTTVKKGEDNKVRSLITTVMISCIFYHCPNQRA